MPEPWEMNDEEAALEAEQLRERHRAADRIAAPLFTKQQDEEDLDPLFAQIPLDRDEPIIMEGFEYPEETEECVIVDGLSGILVDRDEPSLLRNESVPVVPRPKS